MVKLKGVHGLRGFAALAVLVFHFVHITKLDFPASLVKWIEPGYLFVQLFFAISAFTLCYSQDRKPIALREYAARRLLRIAPLFWFVMGFNILLTLHYTGRPPEAISVLLNASLVFNLFPGYEASIVWAGWSVSVEMLFYLVLPAVWLLRGYVALIAALLASVFVSIWFWSIASNNPNFPQHYAYFSILGNLPQFMFGVLAFHLYRDISMRPSKSTQVGWIANGLAIALFWTLLVDPLSLRGRSPGLYFAAWGATFAMLCIGQALAPARVLGSRLAQWIADRSYGIYLFHPIALAFGGGIGAKILVAFGEFRLVGLTTCLVLTIGVVLFAAQLSYRFIEQPAMRLASRLPKREASTPVVA
jgi:peptidoglycan/LPS O-acetylase OafA/YrhL